nr:Chain P, KGPPAALTL peptide [synthetic construct]
KGPPAALTL